MVSNGFLIGRFRSPMFRKKSAAPGRRLADRLRVVRYLRLPFPGSHNPPAATAGGGKACASVRKDRGSVKPIKTLGAAAGRTKRPRQAPFDLFRCLNGLVDGLRRRAGV